MANSLDLTIPPPTDWRERVTLRVNEAAPIVQVSPSKLYRLLVAGKVPGIKIGGVWRVPVRDLRALLGEIEIEK